jgi:ATP synthase protein I
MQALLVTGITWICYYYQGLLAAQAAGYGGCMAIANVWLANRQVRIAIEVAKTSPGKEINILYASAVQRFILVLTLFAVGMGVIHLPPVPLLISFTVAQVGYFFGGRNPTER